VGAGFGNVSRRASAGDAGGLASLRPSSVNWPVRFDLATVILNVRRSFVLNIERRRPNVQLRIRSMENKPQVSEFKRRISVIDVIAHDPKANQVVLVMNEPNEWDGSDDQLLALQERFNAYVSFLLDGEMAEAHPELAGKPARIELRCAHMPGAHALELLGLIHDQLAFQQIKLEVVVRNQEPITKSE
jgi:hypothetical protein